MTHRALSLADVQAFDEAAPPSGSRYLCPLCGEGKPRDAAHRCLSVNRANGLYKCFRCGVTGKLKEHWEERPATPRARSRHNLKRAFEVPPPAPAPVAPSPACPNWAALLGSLQPLAGTPGERYLQGRGVPLALAEASGVQYAPDWAPQKPDKPAPYTGGPAVVFPIHQYFAEGRALSQPEMVAAQGRYIWGQAAPKVRTANAKKNGVFATWDAWNPGPLAITEAPIDALSLSAAGLGAIALCGKDGFPPWLPAACRDRLLLMALDGDMAGEKASQAIGSHLRDLGLSVERLRPFSGKDWNALLLHHGVDALRAALAKMF